jgi:hypothetical protein
VNELILEDADDEGAIEIYSPSQQDSRRVRIHNGKKIRFFDLSAHSARQLRDWLDEWLGDTEKTTWTKADVERLVGWATTVSYGWNAEAIMYRDQILSPFQPPDPDAELIEEMAKTYTGGQLKNMSYDYPDVVRGNMRKVLSAIREHDARKSGTTSPSH